MAGPDRVLPPIDVHRVRLAVPAADAWRAVIDVFSSFACGPTWRAAAKALRCEPQTATSGDRDKTGATLSGFRVMRSKPPTEWALAGEHRFARYALTFRIESLDGGHSRVTAATSAEFPGYRGAAYRALVVGTRGHVLGISAILRSIKRYAERTQ